MRTVPTETGSYISDTPNLSYVSDRHYVDLSVQHSGFRTKEEHLRLWQSVFVSRHSSSYWSDTSITTPPPSHNQNGATTPHSHTPSWSKIRHWWKETVTLTLISRDHLTIHSNYRYSLDNSPGNYKCPPQEYIPFCLWSSKPRKGKFRSENRGPSSSGLSVKNPLHPLRWVKM